MFKKVIISTILAGSFMLLPACYSSNKKTHKEPHFTPRRDYSQSHSHAGATDAVGKKKEAKIETGKKPAWINGGSSQFPSHTYLTAVGFAKTRKQAEENARMEMSQIFNTKIQASRTSSKHAHAVRQDGKVKLSEMEFNAETIIKNETEAIFAGLELARYWRNEKGTIYVLALINKAKVMPPLKEKMMKLDNVIEKLVNEAKNSQDKLTRIKKLNKALKKAVLREYYNSQVAIMSSMGQTVKTEYDVETISHQIDIQLEKLTIAVSVSGEGNKTIRNAIIKTLGDLNLKVNADASTVKLDEFEDFNEDSSSKPTTFNSNVDIIILGEVSFKALDRGDNYKWVSGEVSLSVKNNKTNKIYNSVTVRKKIRRMTLQDARRMAGIKLTKQLIKDLSSNILNIIGNDEN